MSYIEINNVNKSFADLKALTGINVTIEKGELVSLLGPSGCGKSTLLRIIAGLETADSGIVKVDGKDLSNVPVNKRNMGMVFQSYSLFPNMTAEENIAFGLKLKKLQSEEIKRKVNEIVELVDLKGREKHYPNQLSGGQQQRVAIARSLVNDPVVILADEATGNLDTRTSYEIMSLFQDLNAKGKTIVFVTHEPDIARCMTRSVVFRDGHIIREEEVKNRLDAAELLRALPVEQD